MSKAENITVEIAGMSCASCAQRIEPAIDNTEGVSEFSNLLKRLTGSVVRENRMLRLIWWELETGISTVPVLDPAL